MSQFGIEFGNRSVIGGGLDTGRISELRERAVEEAGESGETGSAKTFGDFMKDLVQDANESSLVADKKMQEVATGRTKDLHGAVLAVEKADVQFHLLTQVRNKVIDAYREIMRMQI
jgi:flagellar hook-basal body complex protein FliE